MSKYAPHHRSSNPRPNASTICQKCLKHGHFIYECKEQRPYVSRPSRTKMLETPGLAKLKASGKPSVEVPEEFKTKEGTANKILEAREKMREDTVAKGKGKERDMKKAKRQRSSSDSESNSDSGSDSGSSSSGSRSSDSERSRERDRSRRIPTTRPRSQSASKSRSPSRGRL
ncbi:zinc knuckle-domain-containing protein [Mycena amicta]|nr:zinc knuckle-domain-containing protein [Mycena amicta]